MQNKPQILFESIMNFRADLISARAGANTIVT